MAENLDLALTADAWASIVISKWRQKLNSMKIEHTGNLFRSFYYHVHNNAQGNPYLILFAFEKYGLYVNAGVGREVSKGNSGKLQQYASFSSQTRSMVLNRRAKKWFSSVYYREVRRLQEIIAQKYGEKASKEIVIGFSSND
jgi:hypothetical protein